MKTILITGGAGFICFYTAKKLIELGCQSKTPIEVGVEQFVEWFKNYYL